MYSVLVYVYLILLILQSGVEVMIYSDGDKYQSEVKKKGQTDLTYDTPLFLEHVYFSSHILSKKILKNIILVLGTTPHQASLQMVTIIFERTGSLQTSHLRTRNQPQNLNRQKITVKYTI